MEGCEASQADACDAVDATAGTASADCNAASGAGFGNRCIFTAASGGNPPSCVAESAAVLPASNDQAACEALGVCDYGSGLPGRRGVLRRT